MVGEHPAPHAGAIVDRIRHDLGLDLHPADLAFEWRQWRWMALLPEVVLLVAADGDGWNRLRREATLIRAAGEVVGPAIPAVLGENGDLLLQVRESKHGLHGGEIERQIFGGDPRHETVARFSPDCPLTAWGERFAADLGRTFARVHAAMTPDAAHAIGFAPHPIRWDDIERALRGIGEVEHLLRALPRARAWDESRPVDAVVLHGDPHLFNIFAAEDGTLSGLVDFGDAAIGDRHEDLRYVHSQGPRFARIAIDAYADEAGTRLDPKLVARLHVRSAYDHFAWWDFMVNAGRGDRIIAWATEALAILTPDWAG